VRELHVDFITSLDGYASGEGWPGSWGLQASLRISADMTVPWRTPMRDGMLAGPPRAWPPSPL
jgi:hypothetical protein